MKKNHPEILSKDDPCENMKYPEILDKDEMKKLAVVISKLFKHIELLRCTDELACLLKRPQLPEILSVSLVMHLISRNKILKKYSKFEMKRGGNKEPDIKLKKGEVSIKIEVKGTGNIRYQGFSKKDLNADFLIWADFGELSLLSNNSKIELYIVKDPKKQKLFSHLFKEKDHPQKTLDVFLELIGKRNYKKYDTKLNQI